MLETMPVSQFKATCLQVLDQVKNTGTPIVITKRGEPCAMVTAPPSPPKKKSWLGSFQGELEIVGDIIEPASTPEEWDVLK